MSKQHLYEIDLLRTFVILGVLCVHVISFYNLFAAPLSTTNVGFEAALKTFHFTRESFMFITGLVLFITYYHRQLDAKAFWLKRFKLIFIPYISWTLIYILFEGTYLQGYHWTASYVLTNLLESLITGNQFFMYYLLISMQFYLVFPLVMAGLRRFQKWHKWIFVISFMLEIATMWWNEVYLQQLPISHYPTWLHLLIQYRDRNLLTYQFWFIAGALIAIHYAKIRPLIMRYSRWLYLAFGAVLASSTAQLLINRVLLHQSETLAVLVLQPIMIPYSLFVTFVFLELGIRYDRSRSLPKMRRFSHFTQLVAEASFGVFLVHPLILHYIEVFIYALHPNTALRVALVPISILVVYGVGIFISKVIGSIPFLSYIVGQKKLPEARTHARAAV